MRGPDGRLRGPKGCAWASTGGGAWPRSERSRRSPGPASKRAAACQLSREAIEKLREMQIAPREREEEMQERRRAQAALIEGESSNLSSRSRLWIACEAP